MARGVRTKSEVTRLYSAWSVIMTIIVLVAGSVLSYHYVDFPWNKCGDVECYYEKLANCERSYLVYNDGNYFYRYDIWGVNGEDSCDVEVKLLRIVNANADGEKLEGLKMVCVVDKNDRVLPDTEMKMCSGPLREELQEIIIDRLHNQILNHIDEIANKVV